MTENLENLQVFSEEEGYPAFVKELDFFEYEDAPKARQFAALYTQEEPYVDEDTLYKLAEICKDPDLDKEDTVALIIAASEAGPYSRLLLTYTAMQGFDRTSKTVYAYQAMAEYKEKVGQSPKRSWEPSELKPDAPAHMVTQLKVGDKIPARFYKLHPNVEAALNVSN